MIHDLVVMYNDSVVAGCATGYATLCYSVVDGLGMIYDKIVHKTPILWEPETN